MPTRPIRFRWAHIGSVCLAAAISAVIVFSFYQTLKQIEKALPNFGFFSIRELSIAIQDVSHLQDMVTLARLAPDLAESIERLSEANDLVYVRFTRQDQSRTIRDYPEYAPIFARANAVVGTLDGLLARGRPLAVHELEPVGKELAAIKSELTAAYFAIGNATNTDLAEIQQRLGQLNIQTAIVLSVLSALAIGVAILLVDRRNALRAMRLLAWQDPLTGLKNRAWLLANADAILRSAAAGDSKLSLFLIDVDLFKEVNDTFGHQTGDAVLRVVGKHLAGVEKRYSGYAVRLGGDEFAVLLQNSSSSTFERAAGELNQGLNSQVDFDGILVRMSASIGIAYSPEHGVDLDTLLRHADYALYAAKAKGGGTNVLFSPEITGQIENQLRLYAAIRQAIGRDELFLDWQPQYELISGKLSGAEALVRWRNPATNEIVHPVDFIPAAERSDLILEIDRFVLTKACRQAAAWNATASRDFTFSVNISARHLQRPELSDFVRKTLEATGLEPWRLELEITESAFIENKQLALGVLLQLQALGVRVALDDFGTGYSSLSYLVDLHVTRIKIDRSFISDLMASPEKRNVVKSIMALAHSLDLDVVAEGVETAEQTAFLMQLKCRYAQGFLLSRPISAADMTSLLAGEKWVTPELIEDARRILAA